MNFFKLSVRKRENRETKFLTLNNNIKVALVLLGAVAGQEFKAGRRLPKAILAIDLICSGAGTFERSFCNGFPFPTCDADAVVVSIVRHCRVNCVVHEELIFSDARALDKVLQ